jgi:hypothetical protein
MTATGKGGWHWHNKILLMDVLSAAPSRSRVGFLTELCSFFGGLAVGLHVRVDPGILKQICKLCPVPIALARTAQCESFVRGMLESTSTSTSACVLSTGLDHCPIPRPTSTCSICVSGFSCLHSPVVLPEVPLSSSFPHGRCFPHVHAPPPPQPTILSRTRARTCCTCSCTPHTRSQTHHTYMHIH